jgi:hypothetical protein
MDSALPVAVAYSSRAGERGEAAEEGGCACRKEEKSAPSVEESTGGAQAAAAADWEVVGEEEGALITTTDYTHTSAEHSRREHVCENVCDCSPVACTGRGKGGRQRGAPLPA